MPEISHDEAGRRCSDTIRLHIAAGNAGRWVAIRLSDGGSDGVVYDTRRDAIRHQLHETQCAYMKVPADNCPPREATRFMAINRELYDKGMRLADPDSEREVMIPDRAEDAIAALRLLQTRGLN